MKFRFILVLPVFILAIQVQQVLGQGYNELLGQDRLNTISTAVPFLMIAPDARAAAMGDAGVASSPDANSMHWNPAKYAFTTQDFGLAMNYTPWLRALVPDINLSYLGGFYRIDDLQTIAFSLVYFSVGEIFFTDEVGNQLFPVKPNEFAVSGTYARKLGEHISGAVTARYIRSDLTQGQFAGGIETKPGVAFAADVSTYYQREFDWNQRPVTFAAGLNISNIGNKISYTEEVNADFIPINMRLGPRLTFDLDEFNQFTIMADLNKLLVPTPPVYKRDDIGRVVFDDNGNYVIESGRDPNRSVVSGMMYSFFDAPGGAREELNEITYSAGMEYWYDQQFAIRAGYFHEHKTKGNRKYFTLGVGLKYNIFGLDFAYVVPVAQRSPLENVMRFSLHFDFAALRQN